MGRPKKIKSGSDDVAAALAARVLEKSEQNSEVMATEKDREMADIVEDLRESGNRAPEGWIYRLDMDTGKETFLDKVSAALVDESWLARTYGGGDYRVQVRGFREDTGKYGYIMQRRYSVDAKIPRKTPKWATEREGMDSDAAMPDGLSGALTPGKPDDDMALLLKSQILDMVRSSAEQRRTDSQMQQASIQMMMSMMKQSSDMMQTMMATMLTSRQDGTAMLEKLLPVLTPRQSDPLELLAKLKALDGPKQGLGEIVEAIRSLRESSELFAPIRSGDDDDGMLSVVKSLAPGVMGMLTQAQAREAQAVGAGGVPRLAGSTATANYHMASPASVHESDSGKHEGAQMFDVWKSIAPFVPMIAEKAAMDDDPEEYGYSVVGFVPMMMRGTLRELANRPEAAQELVARFPALRPYPQWVESFVGGIRSAMSPDSQPTAEGNG